MKIMEALPEDLNPFLRSDVTIGESPAVEFLGHSQS
jgi:hypothetical protein